MFKKENLLFIEKAIKNKNDLFNEIAKKAVELGITENEKGLFAGFKERESLGSTGFMDGFGIPHCRTSAVLEPSVIFVRAKKAIKWDSMDGQPLTNMFALIVPEGKLGSNDHLKALAMISRKIMDDSFRNKIKSSKTEADIVKLIQGVFK